MVDERKAECVTVYNIFCNYKCVYECNICFISKVPGLYNTEELEPIISLLKDVAAQEGFVGSPTSYFFKCKMIN